MKSRDSQKSRVLLALADGPITQRDAMCMGIYRLAARINDLRKEGYYISTELVTVVGRHGPARIARYHLGSQ